MTTVWQDGIPTNGAHVNVADLHPELRHRIREFCVKSGLPVQIRSGARTHAHQLRLYKAFVARGRSHPLVANPNYLHPTTKQRGSAHMVQRPFEYRHGNLPNDKPWAYAVDVMWISGYPTRSEQQEMHRRAQGFGLYANVPSEWWHLVATRNDELQASEDDMTDKLDEFRRELDELTEEMDLRMRAMNERIRGNSRRSRSNARRLDAMEQGKEET